MEGAILAGEVVPIKEDIIQTRGQTTAMEDIKNENTSNNDLFPESIHHLPKENQAEELKSAITGNQLGKTTDIKRKALESVRRLMHKRFGTDN